MLILFWFLACMYVSLCKIIIKDVGVATLTRDDVGMIFYVTLRNIGSCKYNVKVKMIKCCEKFTENDLDCGMMNLIGGDMGVLFPNTTKNISLIYPNMYLHNRRGQCLISLKYKSEKDHGFEAKETITFDTYIREKHVNPILRGYYTPCEYKRCNTIDEDPLQNCAPINCHMKYLGCRNYYNHKWRRCQKVPICVADPAKELPDVSYIPISNMCRDLEDLISVDDLKLLDKGIDQGSLARQSSMNIFANVRCHHGMLSNETGFCICDDGWMSAPLDKDQYEPSLSIYHMCNIEIDTWSGVNSIKIKITAILLVIFGGLTTIFIIMLSFLCHFLHQCLKSKRKKMKKKPFTKTSTQTDDDSVTSFDDDQGLPKSASKNTSTTLTSKNSVGVAARRDSKLFQRKSFDYRKNLSGLNLPILPHSSISRGNSTDLTENSDIEQTESFHPARPKEDSD